MKTYEVIIDLSSKIYMIEADNETQAKEKALKQFADSLDKIDEYWVGDCNEVK